MRLLRIGLVVLLALVPLIAQEPTMPKGSVDEPPTLSDTERLHLQVTLQNFEIARLRLQLMQHGYEQSQAETQDALRRLEVPGWRLDLQKFVYVKVGPAAPAGETSK